MIRVGRRAVELPGHIFQVFGPKDHTLLWCFGPVIER